jgi:endonuclease YncB( thermonuclease family)
MRIPHSVMRLILLVSVLTLAFSVSSAATLSGKVVKVDEGDLLTVTNLNRPIKIRLLGVDAPDTNQPFSDVAREHLAQLVLNKFVVVQYSGFGPHNYIVGKVLIGETDICAQMIRDGVAWYSDTDAGYLSPEDRDTYRGSEQAARAERRGIWGDANPVAPWEFRRLEKEKNLVRQPQNAKQSGSSSTNNNFKTAGAAANTAQPAREEYSEWKMLVPEGFNFSVRVPANTVDQGVIVPFGIEKADINVAEGNHVDTTYMVIWAKGPNFGASDGEVIERVAKDMGKLTDLKLKQMGTDATFAVQLQSTVRVGSMNGKQYHLTSPRLAGVMRIFARNLKGERQIYVLCAVNGAEADPSVKEFLNSLKLNNELSRTR